MPTLAANLLSDESEAPKAKAPKSAKRKSLVVGKGGPGSGPQGGGSMSPEQVAAIKASGKAAYATEGAKTAIQHALAFGFHERAAAANAHAGNHDAAAMHERAAGFHKSEARRLSSVNKCQSRLIKHLLAKV